jgi:hypothetical protein
VSSRSATSPAELLVRGQLVWEAGVARAVEKSASRKNSTVPAKSARRLVNLFYFFTCFLNFRKDK